MSDEQPPSQPAASSFDPTQPVEAMPTQPMAARQPTGSLPGQPSTGEVLDSGSTVLPGDGGPRRSHRGRTIAVAAAAAAAVVLAAGGAFAWSALSSSGDEPEQHLPASAIAYLKFDFDPSASQKIDALQFARKFPSAKAPTSTARLSASFFKRA